MQIIQIRELSALNYLDLVGIDESARDVEISVCLSTKPLPLSDTVLTMGMMLLRTCHRVARALGIVQALNLLKRPDNLPSFAPFATTLAEYIVPFW